MCRDTTAVKISACTFRRRPVSGSGSRPIWAKSIWHSTPGSPSATRTVVAASARNPHRSTANRCNVRYGTTHPCRASSSSIFTIDSGSAAVRRRRPRPGSAPRAQQRLPRRAVPVRAGRADRRRPPRRSARRSPRPRRRRGPAPRPAAASTYRRAVLRSTPARSATFRSPGPLQPGPQHLTHLDHADLPESPPAADLHVDGHDAGESTSRPPDPPARRAGWSHDWQTRWSHEPGRKPLRRGPMLMAGDEITLAGRRQGSRFARIFHDGVQGGLRNAIKRGFGRGLTPMDGGPGVLLGSPLKRADRVGKARTGTRRALTLQPQPLPPEVGRVHQPRRRDLLALHSPTRSLPAVGGNACRGRSASHRWWDVP